MKERNAYTCFLFLTGILATAASGASFVMYSNGAEALAAALLVSVFGFFYIRLPNQFYFSFESCGVVFMMMKYNLLNALFPAYVGLILLYFMAEPKKYPLNWFRFFVSLGMFFVAFGIADMVYIWTGKESNIWAVISLVGIIHTINLLLKKGIQISILGKAVLRPAQWQDILDPFTRIIITSLIIIQLYNTNSFVDFIQELVLSSILLYFITFLSKLNTKQTEALEEIKINYEACFNASNQMFLVLDRQAVIQSFNSVAEITLGFSKSTVVGTPMWSILPSDSNQLMESFGKALEGEAESLIALFTSQDGSKMHIKVTLVPFVKNKKISGVYFLGNLTTNE